MDAAENSQDSGTLQTLKTMDSISSKLEQLKLLSLKVDAEIEEKNKDKTK